ncbi:MAG: glycosyltransferase, partial [Gammaproteobacteria bacterium]
MGRGESYPGRGCERRRRPGQYDGRGRSGRVVIGAVVSGTLQGLFVLIEVYYAIYVLLELRTLWISRKAQRRELPRLSACASSAPDTAFAPPVSVLLPVRDVPAVIERLIDAVCRLRYPRSALEILVLDDSADETTLLAQRRIDHWRRQGVDIRLVRRKDREGFKAGNLANGIREASGDFFVIFDADFVPPEDFLLRTMPCFRDPKLGYLQTGIAYENRDKSFLTRFQAMEMGHQQVVNEGLSADGDMASLTGTSCIWRRACVEALGGWDAATVTEDVDLNYRAQLGDWKYAYLREVVSTSLLPETVSAYRLRRERWGRGLIHNAFRHVGRMFARPMTLMQRLHAISVMFSSLLLASIYLVVLLSLPLTWLTTGDEVISRWGVPLFYGLVTLWALDNAVGAQRSAGPDADWGRLRSFLEIYP